MNGATQLINYNRFHDHGLSNYPFPQKSALSRLLTDGQWHKFTGNDFIANVCHF